MILVIQDHTRDWLYQLYNNNTIPDLSFQHCISSKNIQFSHKPNDIKSNQLSSKRQVFVYNVYELYNMYESTYQFHI